MNISGLQTSGIHSHLEALFAVSGWRRLPDCAGLNRLWQDNVPRIAGAALQFVQQDAHLPFAHLTYAQRIARAGLIATRPGNWHDLFNALTWLSFPRTKLAITLRLADGAGTDGGSSRTAEHNALTLFDECAVVLACADPALHDLHAAYDWRNLFVAGRAAWGTRVRPIVFGHGFYDQARSPYLGLTAKAWYAPVPAAWLALPAVHLQALLDERLAATLPGTLMSPRQLLPLPALGVPGWWAPNAEPAFYDNTDYFRPKPIQIHGR